MRKRTLGPGQPEPLPWPDAPEGWRWCRKGTPCQLEGPDGWTTANYNYPERALAEARRRILSQPKPKEAAVTTQTMSTDQALRTLRSAGYTVKAHGLNFLVGATQADTTVLDSTALINLAQATQGAGESPAGWTAQCGQCGQQFISDAPVADGATCPNCNGAAARGTPVPIGALSNGAWLSLPMIDLFPMLEAHAKRLGTLTPDTLIPVPRGLPDRLLVPIGTVVPGRYQPRSTFDEAELADLADSIREHGILNPPLVFVNEKADFELIAGERRLRAAHLVGLSMLPVEVRPYTLKQIAEISGVDNLQRAQLSALEKGRYFNRLISELGLSENALAKRLGIARPTIQQCRAVASGATALHTALDAEQITFSQARAIALAAPGDHAAQRKAIKQLETWLSQGRKVSEADARNATESAVLASATKKLEALGWTIAKSYNSTRIWAPGERPRGWTGAEMLSAIAEQKKPNLTPPPADALDSALLANLDRRYHVTRDHYPWIGLADSYSEVPTFYAPAELAPIVAQLDADLAAITAQAAAQGWTIKPGGNHHFELNHPDGAYRSVWGWSELQKVLKELPKAKTASANMNVGYTPPKKICATCGKGTTAYTHFEDDVYCDRPCLPKARKAAEQRKAAAQAQIDAAIGPWLLSAPEGALRLIFSGLGWRVWQAIGIDSPSGAAANAQQIAALPVAKLARGIATMLGERFDEQRANPVASFPETLERTIALTFTHDEVAKFPGQAARAVELLAEDGYATVADFVRVAARALTGNLAAADEEGAAAAPVEAPTGPLAEIEAAVEELEDWAENLLGYGEDELLVTQAEAAAIRESLEALADSPDVADADYELLSDRLGDIQQAIKAALKHEAVTA